MNSATRSRVESACAPGNGGVYRIEFVRDGKVEAAVESSVKQTQSWNDFAQQIAGSVGLQAGKYEMHVKALKMENALMNLRRVTVRPNP